MFRLVFHHFRIFMIESLRHLPTNSTVLCVRNLCRANLHRKIDDARLIPSLMNFLRDARCVGDAKSVFGALRSEATRDMFGALVSCLPFGDSFEADEVREITESLQKGGFSEDPLCTLCLMEMRLRLCETGSVRRITLPRLPHQQYQRKFCDLFCAQYRSNFSPAVCNTCVEALKNNELRNNIDEKGLFFLLGNLVSNDAATPRQALSAFELTDSNSNLSYSAKTDLTLKEQTACKMFLKCVRWTDIDTFEQFRSSLQRRDIRVSSQILSMLPLIKLHILVANGCVNRAFDTIEDEFTEEQCQHVDEPLTFSALRFRLLDTHPVRLLVSRITERHAKSVDEAYFYLESRHSSKRPVTAKSLNVIMSACAKLHDEARAFETFEAFEHFGAKPTTDSFSHLLCASSYLRGSKLADKMERILASEVAKKYCAPRELLDTLLKLTTAAGDAQSSFKVIRRMQSLAVVPCLNTLKPLVLLLAQMRDRRRIKQLVATRLCDPKQIGEWLRECGFHL